MNRQILLHHPIGVSPSSFAELRDATELYYAPDKIYWAWRIGINHLNLYQITWGLAYNMARNSSGFNDWTFANVRLSVNDEKKFSNWFLENETNILPMLSEIVADSYKFSISYDFDNECFIAALSGTKYSEVNKKSTLTARSNEWLEAIALLLFKHVVMCTMQEWSDFARPSNWG